MKIFNIFFGGNYNEDKYEDTLGAFTTRDFVRNYISWIGFGVRFMVTLPFILIVLVYALIVAFFDWLFGNG
jgi:hypothetical protein